MTEPFSPNIIQLQNQLKKYSEGSLIFREIVLNRPNLFSASVVNIKQSDYDKISKVIKTIEKVLNHIKESKQNESAGVFMGFDFHLTKDGPRLIEINTNAGGALLNLELARSHININSLEPASIDKIAEEFFRMFLNEWKLQRGIQPLRNVAIIDHKPEEQFLYPEFLLFKELMESHKTNCFICDLKDLEYKENGIYIGREKLDLIYNRLTDFYLNSPASTPILKAYEQNLIVLTPSPYHFDLYANKTNLELLTDKTKLISLGISDDDIETLLTFIPKTVIVTKHNQSQLWEQRKNYFFKPFIGYGSKAAYRGDKITSRVWDEIIKNDYVAQELALPSKKIIFHEGSEIEVKIDLRAYVYEGRIQLMAARLYSGQTTNFRTPGGGFAPVFVIP